MGVGARLQSLRLLEAPTLLFCLSLPLHQLYLKLSGTTYIYDPAFYREQVLLFSQKEERAHKRKVHNWPWFKEHLHYAFWAIVLECIPILRKLFFTINKKKWKINWLCSKVPLPFTPNSASWEEYIARVTLVLSIFYFNWCLTFYMCASYFSWRNDGLQSVCRLSEKK